MFQLRMPIKNSLVISFHVSTVALEKFSNMAKSKVMLSDVTMIAVVISLGYDVVKNIWAWRRNSIILILFFTSIINCDIEAYCGFAGSTAGAYALSALVPYLCTVMGSAVPGVGVVAAVGGAITGGLVASTIGGTISDRLTQWMFGLPANVALEQALTFMELKNDAKDDDIIARFDYMNKELTPVEGKFDERYARLHYSMALIVDAMKQRKEDKYNVKLE